MTTPTSRRPPRGTAQSPPAASPTLSRSSSAIEPKSEYLRNALEARRAKEATPSPAPTSPAPPIQRRVTSTTSSVDPWLEQAVSEEDTPQIRPARRHARRPSEGAMPRLPTQRELQTETEALKQAMFDLNLKLELLKKQNSDLKDTLDEANKRIEDLEPLEDANIDLQDDNNRLVLRNQTLEDDNANLEDDNAELRSHNAEILKIQDETVAQMEQLQGALEEAADVIIRSEAANTELREENARLNAEISSARSSGEYYSADAASDTHPKQLPSRIYSIDESRPSTSHFDSDYYSQPASPAQKPKKSSKDGLKFSERAKSFLDINMNGKRSIQELKKRVSDISMKQSTRSRSPVPEVPQIPEGYVNEQSVRSIKRTPGRRPQTSQGPTVDTSGRSYKAHPTTPRTPTAAGPRDGLRDLYRSGKSIDKSRPSTSSKSPAPSKASRGSDHEQNPFLTAPPRISSRRAHTSSSSEQLRSVADLSMSDLAAELPPPPSVVSEVTEDIDPRDKWWKDMADYPHQKGGRRDKLIAVAHANRALEGNSRPKPPQPELSFGGDFLFNMEDEDQFMTRVHSQMPRRRCGPEHF